MDKTKYRQIVSCLILFFPVGLLLTYFFYIIFGIPLDFLVRIKQTMPATPLLCGLLICIELLFVISWHHDDVGGWA